MTKKLRVQRQRRFCPHHTLLDAAHTALEAARAKRPSYFNYYLMCITFSSLSIEAIGNAFGERLIKRWDDFESAAPVAKLRLVCDHLKVKIDFSAEPWATVLWLVRFRNQVAHAKPQNINEDHTLTREEWDKLRRERPESKLEGLVTLENAEKAYACADKIFAALCENLPHEEIEGLLSDGWTSQAGPDEQDARNQ